MAMNRIILIIFCLLNTLVYSQNDLSKLMDDGFNKTLPTKSRIKALHAAAELMTNANPDSSYILLDTALRLISKSTNTEFHQANNLIRAKTFLIQGVYPKALDFAQKSLILSEKLNKKRLVSDCYGVLGQIYERQQNNKKAEKLYTTGFSRAGRWCIRKPCENRKVNPIHHRSPILGKTSVGEGSPGGGGVYPRSPYN